MNELKDKECITISSSDDEGISGTGMIKPVSSFPKGRKRIALHTVANDVKIFEQFLDKCKKLRKDDPDMDTIIQKMWTSYKKVDESYKSSSEYKNFVNEKLLNLNEGNIFSSMRDVRNLLKEHIHKQIEPSVSIESVLDPKVIKKIKELEITLEKLRRIINHLDNKELDYDECDSKNSSYIKSDRYKRRLREVYQKICELRKSKNEANVFHKIKFNGTGISSVDTAIQEYYNEKRTFPDYHDILKVIQIVNQRDNLGYSTAAVEETAIKAFTELGNELQLRRKRGEYDHFNSYLPDDCTPDPADTDETLRLELEQTGRIFKLKMNKEINKHSENQIKSNVVPEDVDDDVPSSDGEEEYEDIETEEDDDNSIELMSEKEISDFDDVITGNHDYEMRDCVVLLHRLEETQLLNRIGTVTPQTVGNISKESKSKCEAGGSGFTTSTPFSSHKPVYPRSRSPGKLSKKKYTALEESPGISGNRYENAVIKNRFHDENRNISQGKKLKVLKEKPRKFILSHNELFRQKPNTSNVDFIELSDSEYDEDVVDTTPRVNNGTSTTPKPLKNVSGNLTYNSKERSSRSLQSVMKVNRKRTPPITSPNSIIAMRRAFYAKPSTFSNSKSPNVLNVGSITRNYVRPTILSKTKNKLTRDRIIQTNRIHHAIKNGTHTTLHRGANRNSTINRSVTSSHHRHKLGGSRSQNSHRRSVNQQVVTNNANHLRPATGSTRMTETLVRNGSTTDEHKTIVQSMMTTMMNRNLSKNKNSISKTVNSTSPLINDVITLE